MGINTGTVADDPEELNNYVKEQIEKENQEAMDKLEREQEEARERQKLFDD